MIEFILSALAAIVLAALGAMAGAQANASAPAVARWIVRRAVLRLPPELRERYTEQWLADLQDIPGPLAKLWTAVGFVVSTGALGREHAGKQLVAEVNPQSSVKRGVRGQLGYAVGYVTGSFVRAMSLYLKFVERAAVKAA
jgi:hypothetical protein